MGTLARDFKIDNRFTVDYIIKENSYCECYRVTDTEENPYFLKLYILKDTPKSLINEDGDVAEIALYKKLDHAGINPYVSSGKIMIDKGVGQFLITEYFNGELLAEKLQREGCMKLEQARPIVKAMAETLHYLHDSLHLLHNDITPRNIMISPDGRPTLIDFGHASGIVMGIPPFDINDLNLQFCSTTAIAGLYTIQNDIYALVSVFYAMLTGNAPWFINLPADLTRRELVKRIREARRAELNFSNTEPECKAVILKGLGLADEKYTSMHQFIYDLDHLDELEVEEEVVFESRHSGNTEVDAADKTDIEIKRGGGNGFADIAGMAELKDMLEKRVIFILKDKERAMKYRLTPPNGMLLYGPPGCGKSFFAEKFAEETDFNFMLVKASDLGSIYIHGTQGKIADLFKKAEQNAPTVICFDEFDAFVPNRSNGFDAKQAGEVNEFLSQLNNCSKRGIFVIATSNRPDMIDPAVLRTGRIDKLVYVPLPDLEARREMLALHMKGRPVNEDIDYNHLAQLADGYVASDIAYAVNEAAMIAAFNDESISQQLLETTIQGIKPSVKPDVVKQYEEIREKMEGIGRSAALPKIGFK